jgi:hypothetical protein
VGFAEAGVAVDEERIVGLRGGLGDGDRGGVGELVVWPDDEVLECIARVEICGVKALVDLRPARVAGGGAGGFGGLGSGVGGDAIGGGGGGVAFAQGDADHATGGKTDALSDQVEVVVVDPDGGEFVGHAQHQGILGGFDAGDGLKPHLENFIGKETLEVAFHGFPEIRGCGGGGHCGRRRHSYSQTLTDELTDRSTVGGYGFCRRVENRETEHQWRASPAECV